MSSPLPTPGEMIAHLDRYVRGQARAKRDISVAFYNHYFSQAWRDRGNSDLGLHHILMIGPTGVGKTYLVRTLAGFLGVPVGFASATDMAETGYKGNSVHSVIESLLGQAGNDPKKAEKGIVFIDEIDKIRKEDTGGVRDVSGEGVQNGLLSLLDGRISEGIDGRTHKPVDTSRLLFVCTGAFVGLQEIIERRIGKSKARIGFLARPEEPKEPFPDQPIYEALCQAETKDLVNYGMIPEFIGRFASITVLHELGRGDLRAIVGDDVENSAIQRHVKMAALHGIELVFRPDALDAVTEEAHALGAGARGLHRLIGRAIDGVDYRFPELANQGVTKIQITADTVLRRAEPVFKHGKAKCKRKDKALRKEALAGLPQRPRGKTSPGASENHGTTDVSGWNVAEIYARCEALKFAGLDWDKTGESARKWWEAFESENKQRPQLILRLVEELVNRDATINEFFLSYIYSNTDNIQANLHYLDYMRLKKKEAEKEEKDEKDE